MQAPYTAPKIDLAAFHCPHCGAFAKQRWSAVAYWVGTSYELEGWKLARCEHCGAPTLWLNQSMIYPSGGSAPLPNPDLPLDIREDYEEVRAILNRSPRGAAALPRPAVQKLCKTLDEPGKNINNDIGNLVKKGLLPQVQQALDVVRVVGNNAVHPVLNRSIQPAPNGEVSRFGISAESAVHGLDAARFSQEVAFAGRRQVSPQEEVH